MDNLTEEETPMTTQTEKHIPMNLWGKDHWSALGYIECRCVDHKGVPERNKMRCDADVHPSLTNSANRLFDRKYPTRLKQGEAKDHDDWSCAEDMEREGLIEWKGTGINPVFVMTKKGHAICAQLRQHKANGGNFATFSPHAEVRLGLPCEECHQPMEYQHSIEYKLCPTCKEKSSQELLEIIKSRKEFAYSGYSLNLKGKKE